MLTANAELKNYRLSLQAKGKDADCAASHTIQAASIEEARLRASVIANDYASAHPEMSVIICTVSPENAD